MKIATKINQLSIKAYMYCAKFTPLLSAGLALSSLLPDSAFADGAAGNNYLAGLKNDVAATFGAGSDVPYFLLLIEGVGGAYAYTKTKNIVVLAGFPVLMLFTHYALK